MISNKCRRSKQTDCLYILSENKTHLTCSTETRPVAKNIALSKAHFKYYFYFLLLFPTEVTCTSLVYLFN